MQIARSACGVDGDLVGINGSVCRDLGRFADSNRTGIGGKSVRVLYGNLVSAGVEVVKDIAGLKCAAVDAVLIGFAAAARADGDRTVIFTKAGNIRTCGGNGERVDRYGSLGRHGTTVGILDGNGVIPVVQPAENVAVLVIYAVNAVLQIARSAGSGDDDLIFIDCRIGQQRSRFVDRDRISLSSKSFGVFDYGIISPGSHIDKNIIRLEIYPVQTIKIRRHTAADRNTDRTVICPKTGNIARNSRHC